MDIILKDGEVKEINLEDLFPSDDHGKIIIKGENVGRPEGNKELPAEIKEMIAMDALATTSVEAAKINGISQSTANRWSNGIDVREETRAKILDKKHGIADVAITKLMDSLNIIDITSIEKPMDQIKAAGILAGIVEKVSGKDKEGGQKIELHLYSPKQRSMEDYKVIDV